MSHSVDVQVRSADESAFRASTLGLFESPLMGIAGSAPANSIAAATTALLGAAIYGGQRPRLNSISNFIFNGLWSLLGPRTWTPIFL